MRAWICALLFCSFAIAQEQSPQPGPDFSRGTRERGSFYLNGLGHQYLQGKSYTVVAAAIPVLNGKYFGVKVHVFNRGIASVNMLPESVTVEDSLSAKQLESHSASDVADRLRRPPGWAHVAGVVAGEPPVAGRGMGSGVPTMADLLRELSKDGGTSEMMDYVETSYPVLTTRGAPKAEVHTAATCDLGCELRNREIGDGHGPQLAKRSAKPELLEKDEFLANTIPPDGDAEGVRYFSMPKLTDRAPISRKGKKSYQVTVTVHVGDEKFQFAFPAE
jgi:hypothetical protein